MKTYQEFILEDLRLVSDESSSSKVDTASKYDVLKTPNFFDEPYSNNDIYFYNLMKKDSNLFCKFFKISKQKVLTEKVDTKIFNKKILKEYEDCWSQLLFDIKNKFINLDDLKSKKAFLISYFYKYGPGDISDLNIGFKYDELEKFLKQYFLKCHKIIEFFSKNSKILNYDIDLHLGNFGFRKGTYEIICFDPIFIDK